jgi:ceramide glucosyltransferase
VEQLGACRKTNNLCRLAKEARNELLVMNDSDVRVEKDYLRAVTAPFRDAKVGVVTAFFRGITGSGLASELDAMGIPTEGAPNTILAEFLGTLDYAFGWTMAIPKQRLAETDLKRWSIITPMTSCSEMRNPEKDTGLK